MDLVFIELLEKFKKYKKKYNELLINYNSLLNQQNEKMNDKSNSLIDNKEYKNKYNELLINNYTLINELLKINNQSNSLIDNTEYKNKYNELFINYDILINEQLKISDDKTNINYPKKSLINNTKCFEKIHPLIKQDIKLPQNINDLSFIVKYIVDNSGSLNIIKNMDSFLEINRNKDVNESIDAEFRNIMTEFINEEFFKSDDLLYNFLKNIIEIMELSLNSYIDEKTPKLIHKYKLDQTFTLKNKIIFIFKGGNTLKSILDKYINEQSGLVGNFLNEKYGKYFKRSDLDFQIIIYPKLTTDNNNEVIYTEIVKDLNILTCYTLNRFRNTYLSNLSKTFDFYQYNNVTKQKLLQGLLNKLINSNFIKNKNNSNVKEEFIKKYGEDKNFYFNMKFININFNDVNTDDNIYGNLLSIKNDYTKLLNDKMSLHIFNGEMFNNFRPDIDIKIDSSTVKIRSIKKLTEDPIDKEIQEIIYPNDNDPFRASTNVDVKSEHFLSLIENIRIDRENKSNTLFDLIRIKINFLINIEINDVYGALNIPGELIDITIPNYEDYKKDEFENHTIDELYSRYEFNNPKSKVNNFSFWSYNIRSFTHDLENILFIDNLLPWYDPKYTKRIYRILFLATIQLLSKKNEEIEELINDLKKFTSESLDTIINDENFFIPFLSKYTVNPSIKNLEWVTLFNHHNHIYNFISKKSKNKQSDNDNFKEYYTVIFINVKYLVELIDKINEFNLLPFKGKINVENKEFRIINQFAGDNYKDKYLKYKNKYLRTRNIKLK